MAFSSRCGKNSNPWTACKCLIWSSVCVKWFCSFPCLTRWRGSRCSLRTRRTSAPCSSTCTTACFSWCGNPCRCSPTPKTVKMKSFRTRYRIPKLQRRDLKDRSLQAFTRLEYWLGPCSLLHVSLFQCFQNTALLTLPQDARYWWPVIFQEDERSNAQKIDQGPHWVCVQQL